MPAQNCKNDKRVCRASQVGLAKMQPDGNEKKNQGIKKGGALSINEKHTSLGHPSLYNTVALNIIVQKEFMWMRSNSDLIDFIFPFVANPGFHQVFAEDASL